MTRNLRSGSGWSLIDASQNCGQPGAYDVGTLLGVATSSVWLVTLRAAERWVPTRHVWGRVRDRRREGHVLVEHADGSSHMDNDDLELITNPGLAAVVNVGTELAEVLVVSL